MPMRPRISPRLQCSGDQLALAVQDNGIGFDPDQQQGGFGLTSMQVPIGALLAGGLSAAGVATRLGLSVRAVEGHARAILAGLKARNRAEAVRIYVEARLSEEGE